MPHESPAPPKRPAPGDVIGTPELSAWQTAPGVTWIQTCSPEYARKLARRSDARLVAVGVAGGFMRTCCFRHSLRWARGLIARYTRREACANALKTAPALGVASDSPASGTNAPPEAT
jgi:hypothetical protein